MARRADGAPAEGSAGSRRRAWCGGSGGASGRSTPKSSLACRALSDGPASLLRLAFLGARRARDDRADPAPDLTRLARPATADPDQSRRLTKFTSSPPGSSVASPAPRAAATWPGPRRRSSISSMSRRGRQPRLSARALAAARLRSRRTQPLERADREPPAPHPGRSAPARAHGRRRRGRRIARPTDYGLTSAGPEGSAGVRRSSGR